MRYAALLVLLGAPLLADDFSSRLSEYMKLRKEAVSSVAKLRPTPSREQILVHEHELAAKIVERRGQVTRGNIFTAAAAADFRARISAVLHGPEGTAIRQSLKRSEPVRLDTIQVNGPYPKAIPLQTMPPTLLRALPPLPSGIEYRIVNHGLILLDTEANLIIDFLADVFPDS